jgi:hypothetical protein
MTDHALFSTLSSKGRIQKHCSITLAPQPKVGERPGTHPSTHRFIGLNHYNTDVVSFDLFGGLNKARLTPIRPHPEAERNKWGINPWVEE